MGDIPNFFISQPRTINGAPMFKKKIGFDEFNELAVAENTFSLMWFNDYSGTAIKTHEKTIVIDPVDIVKGPRPDMILISHSHFDHYDARVVETLRQKETVIIASKEVRIEGAKSIGVGDVIQEDGIRIFAEKSVHPGEMPLTFVLELGNSVIYHAIDSQTFDGMREIGEKYKPDVAIVPIGIAPSTSPDAGARAVQLIRPKVAIPHHAKRGFEEFESKVGELAPETKVVVLRKGEIYTYSAGMP